MADRPLPYAPLTPGYGVAEHKRLLVEEASRLKRAKLDPVSAAQQAYAEDEQRLTDQEFAAKYGEAAATARYVRQRMEQRSRALEAVGRTDDQFLEDIPEALGRGVVRWGSGILNTLVQGATRDVVDETLRQNTIRQGLADPGESTRNKVGRLIQQYISQKASQGDEALARRMTEVSRVSEANAQIDAAKLQAQRAADYEFATEVLGESPLIAGTKRVVGEFADAVSNQLNHPVQLSNTVVGEIPGLVATSGAGRLLTTGKSVANRVDQLMERALMARAARNTPLPDPAKLVAQAQQDVQRTNAIRATIGTETALQYGSVYQQVQETPLEVLAENNPEVRAAIDAGIPEAEIKHALGVRQASVAAGVVAALGGPLARLNPDFELNPLRTGTGAAVARLKSAASNVASESVEETGFGALGAFAENMGAIAAGQENVNPVAGVGSGAGEGLVTAAALSGSMQAPGAALASTQLAGQAALAGSKAALSALVEKGKQVRAEAEAPVQKQVQKINERRNQVAATVEAELQDLGQDLGEDRSLDPEVRTQLGAEGLGKVSTLSRVIEAMKVEEDPAKLDQYRIFAVKTARELSQAQSQITARLEAETDPEAKKRLQTLNQAINELVSDESILEMEEAMKEVPVEAVEQVFANLPEDIDTAGIQANPEVMRTLDLVREMSYAAPHKISPEVAERARMLFQKVGNTNPQDMKQLELAQEIGIAEREYQAANQTVYEKFPKVKTADEVRNNILETGFNTGRARMPSLREYVESISAAMSAGNKEVAAGELGNLLAFAVHIAKRARAFDTTANTAIDTGNVDSPLDVSMPSTEGDDSLFYSTILDEEGKLSYRPYRLILGNEKSRAAIDHVFADANLVARYYNALAKRYPELGFVPDADEKQAPTWQKRIDLSQLRAASKPRSFTERLNSTSKPATTAPASTPAPVASESASTSDETIETPKSLSKKQPTEPAAPATDEEDAAGAAASEERAAASETKTKAKTETKQAPASASAAPKAVSRITVEQAKSLSDADLDARINALMDKRAAKTNTAEDDATFDVLDAEMTARETAATEEGSTEQNDAFAAELAAAQETLETGKNTALVDFNAPAKADLNEVLAMSEQDYLARVRGDTPRTSVQTADQIVAELDDMEVPERAQQIGSVGDIALMADGNFLYAVDGERVVGRLGVNAQGTEFAVHPDYQGKGVGKAMMRELLTRNPLAPSGGLTDAAEKTRLSVLRDLRAERAPSMAKRFPTLKDLPEGDLKAKNQWLWAFKLNPNHRGALSNGGMQALRDQLEAGLANILPTEMDGLRTIIDKLVPAITTLLDRQLQAKAAKDKRLMGTDPQLWQFGDKLSLHATNYGQGADTLAYDPGIAEGLALATSLWLMENINRNYPSDLEYIARFLGKEEHEVTPEERHVFLTSQTYHAMVTDLARYVPMVLGLRVNDDAPTTATDGILQALAGDVLNVLVDQKVLIRNEYAIVKDDLGYSLVMTKNQAMKAGRKFTPLFTLSFNRDEKDRSSLIRLRNQLGKPGIRALSALLDPDRKQEWELGEPPKNTERTIRGSSQALSPEQRKVLKNHNEVAFYRNTQFVNWLLKLGKENALRLFGYTQYDPNLVNDVDKVRLDSINQGLVRSWEALVDWNTTLEREATARGIAPEELGTFFQHYLTSNNRVMMEGAVNPQSNKLLREAMVPYRSTMEIGKTEHEIALRLMVGQALGMKVENATDYADVVAEVDARMGEDGDLYPVWTALLQDDMDVPTLMEQMERAGFGANTSGVKAFNAMHAWAAYDRARAAGEKTVQIHLAFEQDGKTDGPSHAIGQLGLHRLSETVFDNLARAGFNFNRVGTALGDVVAELKAQGRPTDLYGTAASGAQKRFQNKIQKLRKIYKNPHSSAADRYLAEKQGRGLAAAVRLFTRIGLIKNSDPEGDTSKAIFERSFAKHAMTATGYGGGVGAIAGEMVKQIQEYLYKELTNSLQTGTPIDPGLADSINALITTELVRVGLYNGGRALIAEEVAEPIDFSDISNYKHLRLSWEHVSAMESHLKEGLAKMLYSSIREEMDSTLEAMDILVSAAKVQTLVLQREFNKAYQAELARAIEAGELLPEQSLSRNQERQILAKLKHLAPIIQFKTTVDVGDRSVGLNMAATDRNAAIVDGKGVRTVKSIAGGMETKVARMGFKDPGVRAGGLTIISAGDATMMAVYFGKKTRPALNVWDGLETGLADVFTSATEINQAVYKAWEFDLLGGISRQFAESLPGLQAAVAADPDLEAMLHTELRLNEKQTVQAFLADMAEELAVMAERTALTKQALKSLSLSIDHMAGARRPFVKDGPVVPREQLVDWVNAEVNRLRAQRDSTKAVNEVKNQLIKPDGPQTFDQVILTPALNHDAVVALMDARMAASGNKVHQFVWKQIRALLPTDLVVHRGTPAEMLAKAREVFPDAELPAEMPAGAYMQGQVFLTNDTTETLLHELVHAAITHLIDRAYNGGRGLTAHQKQAVQELENLTAAFMDLKPTEMDPLTAAAVVNAQTAVEDLLDRNDIAGAVNEFVAWSLTNPKVAALLHTKKAPTGLKALAKKVLAGVRKLLGLPNNGQMETFLEQTMGQFVRLTRVGVRINDGEDARVLYHMLQQPGSTGESPHEVHLSAVYDEIQTVLNAVPPHLLTPEQRIKHQDALVLGAKQRDAFLAAGFPLNKQEQLVFELAQAMFATGLQLDSRVMNAMQHLYNAALKTFTVEDFMADPQSSDPSMRAIAQDQYNAVFGTKALAKDANGRSTQLANFVALALVYKPLRDKLDTMSMPQTKAGKKKKTANEALRSWATQVFDYLSDASLGLSPNLSQRAAIDLLMTQLSQLQAKWARAARTTPGALEQLEEQFKERLLRKAGEKAGKAMRKRQARGQMGGLDGWINLALNSIRAATTEEGARDFGEDVLAVTNSFPKELRELFAELVGGTSVNRSIHELLNQGRWAVAQVRQRLRDEAPQHVRSLFSKPLSKETWGRLVRSIGKTDLQALLGGYSGNQIQAMLEDRTKLDAEIQRLEGLLTARPEWVRSADNLAHYLMTGTQLMANGSLYRNATAIARQPGFGRSYDGDISKIVPIIDRLVTLKALTYLGAHETAELAELFATERKGMEGLLNVMRQRVRLEQGKQHGDRQHLNQWKGYVPVSMDPRREVVLADPKRGAELVKLGYVKLQDYASDSADPNSQGLAYYAISSAGGLATYNQGAMQTIEGSVMGVDYLTGATLAPEVQTLIKNPKVVARITATKKQQGQTIGTPYGLLPVFDDSGNVVAYERPLSKQILDQHLSANPDLAQSIGMWMGRQAEEELAREFNRQVVKALKKIWDDFKGTDRAKEFVDVSDPNASATLRDTWNSIPRETQEMLLKEFGGAVMVRADMINNALGYRSPSIGDAFTGMSDLPKAVREGIVNVASALLGKDAYRYLVMAERTLQGLVGVAKDVIVVRSGMVALANGIANQFQLVMHGLPVTKLLQIQATKVVETKTYLRNAHRIARIQVELDSTTSTYKRQLLERERQSLHDQNSRLSIWPLIKAGELPTIAEGLTEQDEFTLLGDAMRWLEKKAESLPQGMVTAAKYAMISKDTALYQGLNRLIQFSDFVAKAALYDHLVQQRGLDQAEALRIISERFVNYNLLPGRWRDYLERMGLTWFMAYKLRIQKVVLSTLRENPLRFLMAGVGADWLGADSLMSSSAPLTNWEVSVGPGMFWRAHDAILWNQLMK